MAKTRAIVKRRKAIRNIRKITRTMELIATARYKKALDRAVQAEAYTRRIGELVGELARSGSSADHPLLQPRSEIRKTAVLILTSNRGLCGGYNANVLRLAQTTLTEIQSDVHIEVSGKRGIAFCRYRQIPVVRAHTQFEDKPTYDQVEELASGYLDQFLKGDWDRLEVIYTRFRSIAKQEACRETLLPMSEVGEVPASGSAPAGPVRDYEFIPGASEILSEIVPVSFKVRLFKCFLDAAVSEQIARMVAMKGATKSAGTLIKSLTRQYNRARQSQITTELSEIIGTAEALK